MGSENSVPQKVTRGLKSLRNLGSSKKRGAYCTTNYALVFIKPHAVNDKVQEFVKTHLTKHKIKITGSSVREAEQLEKLVDQHYQLIHKHAMVEHPKHLKISEERKQAFKEEFGVAWDTAVAEGRILNLSAFQQINGDIDVGKEWDSKNTAKMGLGPGAAVGKLMRKDEDGEDYHFVINGFYADMRGEFTKEHSKVVCFTVEFEEKDLSFRDFRASVIGKTNPTKAKEGSLRAELLKNWEELGLEEKPDYGKNGVHASAGPIEGLYERNLWFNTAVEDDPFGRALLEAHVDRNTINYFIGNKEIETADGEVKPAFVITEDMDSSQVIEEALALQDSEAFSYLLV